jgi:hypothetical protein
MLKKPDHQARQSIKIARLLIVKYSYFRLISIKSLNNSQKLKRAQANESELKQIKNL